MRLQPLAACYLLLRDDRTRSLRSIHLAIRLRSAIVSARGPRGSRVDTQEHAELLKGAASQTPPISGRRRNCTMTPTASLAEDYSKLCSHTSHEDCQKL